VKRYGTSFAIALALAWSAAAAAQTAALHFDVGDVDGVAGRGQRFNGYTTEFVMDTPAIDPARGFAAALWIAPQEYGLNISGIVDHQRGYASGWQLGIDQHGRVVAGVATSAGWTEVRSASPIPLLRWSHVALSVALDTGVTLYIDGRPAGNALLTGAIVPCTDCRTVVGRNQTALTPALTEREASRRFTTPGSFDGLMDEIQVWDTPLATGQVQSLHDAALPAQPQPLGFRRLPAGPARPVPFGAYFTRLSYAPGWDALWRGSDTPDLVVGFGDLPIRMVFWRGMNYLPAFVSENGLWRTDQSIEHYGQGEGHEVFSDQQNRYSHVRVLENTPARVVVHWRYALSGFRYDILGADKDGWGAWVDEYWTIHPDGVAARKQVLWMPDYDSQKNVMQWQETIFLTQPGMRPQDVVDMQAITFMDRDGQTASYGWHDGPPPAFDRPGAQPVQMVNFKSRWKPFDVFAWGRRALPFSFGFVKGYSTFPNWNHWPLQQSPSDGRMAVALDKPGHTSLTDSNGKLQIVEHAPDGGIMAAQLLGMTDGPISALLPLARSWNAPPALAGLRGTADARYDRYARSYRMAVATHNMPWVHFTVRASAASPLHNLPLEIDGWDAQAVEVRIDGRPLPTEAVRFGRVPGLDGNTVLLFLRLAASHPVVVQVRRAR
jgi:hypothetical protein